MEFRREEVEFRIGDYVRFEMESTISGGTIGKITDTSDKCVICEGSMKEFWDKDYIREGKYLLIPHELIESKIGKILWTM